VICNHKGREQLGKWRERAKISQVGGLNITESVHDWKPATDPEVRVRFSALPQFPISTGSGMRFTQPGEHSTIEEVLGRNSSCSGLESREYGRRDPSR
jgi:hypothetical protein